MIQVENFHKSYGDTVAIHHLSFYVNSGEILGLVGPNGAGKTTTLRSIAGILPPTQGKIRVADYDIQEEPIAAKNHLAYVPDDPNLFDTLTVWEHMLFTAAIYRVSQFEEEAQLLLEQFDLLEKRDTIAQELSRGMRQKVAISCAYLHHPEALMMDEPLTGLDPRGIRTAKNSVTEFARSGAAVIISSHQLDLIEDLCTHLLILNRGQMLYFGTVEEASNRFADENGFPSLEEVFFRITEGDTVTPVSMP